MTFVNDIQNANGNLFDRLSAAIHTLRANRKVRAEKDRLYHQTLRELNALSNRELADIGINRSMIEAIAFEAAHGK